MGRETTPVDVEEVTLTLSGPPATVRAVLDTLTCCCMQMVELLESEREAANNANNGPSSSSSSHHHRNAQRHSSGGFRRRKAPPPLPSAEDVEFWHSPDKEGWLQSQGDHIKTWRRRWHVAGRTRPAHSTTRSRILSSSRTTSPRPCWHTLRHTASWRAPSPLVWFGSSPTTT